MTAVKAPKPINPRSPDTKYNGTEPLWSKQPEPESRQSTLVRAFGWYNYHYGKKEAKEFICHYLEHNHRAKEAKTFRGLPDSAVRVTHIPSGIVVSQQDEKSQHKNKAKALKILRSKLYDLQRSQQESERAKARKSQIGTGDRSERIRTYNFPQGRVTDHRINMTLYKLTDFLAGDAFKELSDAIQIQFQEEQLENLKI